MMSKTCAKRQKKRVNKEKAWNMRLEGWSITEIGRELGLAKSCISLYVKEALEEYSEQMKHEAVHVAEMELKRIDKILKALMPAVLNGDVKSCTCALKALEQRGKIIGYLPRQRVDLQITNAPEDLDPAQLKGKIAAALSDENDVVVELQ